MNSRYIYGLLWVAYLFTVLVSIAYGVLASFVLSGLSSWAAQSSWGEIFDLSKRLIGAYGGCAILIGTLCLYAGLSIPIMCGKICTKKDSPGFWWGTMTGSTFFMVWICLATAMTVQSSIYLAESGAIQLESNEQLSQFANQVSGGLVAQDNSQYDDQLFKVTTVVGYVAAACFLCLSILMIMYECSITCCKDTPADQEPKPPAPEAAPVASGTDQEAAKV